MKYTYRAILGDGVRTCTTCKVSKDLEEFHREKRSVDGRCARCKDCAKAADAARYERDREKKLASVTAYYQANIDDKRAYAIRYKTEKRRDPAYRKAETAAGREWRRRNPAKVSAANARQRAWGRFDPHWTDQEWLDLQALYDHSCLRCGITDVRLEPDHVIPLSQGGPNTIDNIQPLCPGCNGWKLNKTIDFRPGAAA